MFMKEEFKEIAAYEGQEITQALARIFGDKDFNRWLRRTTKRQIPTWLQKCIVWRLKVSKDPLWTVDRLLVFPFLKYLQKHTATCLEVEGLDNLEKNGMFFLTNHRDIVLDAAFLALLLRTKRNIRPYLGAGTNLFGQQWIEDLMRLCRVFCVKRGGSARDVLHNAQVLSAYIADRQAAGESFWMAQREGRAKDGNDVTQPAVLKMLTLAHEDDLLDAVRALHIVPVAITYEYDPCDYLKAREMQLKRDDASYKKSAKEDMLNMQTGLRGQKGEIWYHITPCINPELDAIPQDATRNEQLRMVAEIIDKHIHRGYHLAKTNLAAKTILEGGADAEMEKYVQSRIDLIDIPNKDVAFLRQCLLEMYANPARNAEKARV